MDLKNQWQAETLISQRGNLAEAEVPSKNKITLHYICMSATKYYVGPPKIMILIIGVFNSENLLNIYSPLRHFILSSGSRQKNKHIFIALEHICHKTIVLAISHNKN